jgi:hypothetical protein
MWEKTNQNQNGSGLFYYEGDRLGYAFEAPICDIRFRGSNLILLTLDLNVTKLACPGDG